MIQAQASPERDERSSIFMPRLRIA